MVTHVVSRLADGALVLALTLVLAFCGFPVAWEAEDHGDAA